MRKLIAVVGLALLSLHINAQETIPYYQQYLLEGDFLFNPAQYGKTDDVKVHTTYQKQYITFSESPNVQTLGAHANIFDRVGAGITVFRDANGPISAGGVNLGASYFIPISDVGERKDQFSFGTSITAYNWNLDRTKLNVENPGDLLLEGDNSLFMVYANFGLAATYKGIFAGASVTDIALSNDQAIVNNREPSPIKINLNLGYDWALSENVIVTPSAMMILNTNSSVLLDANLLGTVKSDVNAFSAGVSFRYIQNRFDNQNLSLSPIVKVNLNRFMVGATYNLGLSDIQTVGGNSFMFSLGYNFNNFINRRGYRY